MTKAARRHALRAARRAAGLCPECGGDRDGQQRLCARCREVQYRAHRLHRFRRAVERARHRGVIGGAT